MLTEIDLKEIKNLGITIPNSINIHSSFYFELQKILKSDVFFEIGAFEAAFSRTMKSMFPLAEVWAFEANPFNYEHYKEINSNINYLNLAVSDTDKKINFYLQDKNLNDGSVIEKVRGNNSILNRKDDSISYEKIEVDSITLDSFIEKNSIQGKNFSIWVDVEGANKNILFGFEKYIKDCHSIYIEVEEISYWEEQWLSQDVYNYLSSKDFIPLTRDFEDNNQYNVIFINKKILNKNTNKIKQWVEDYFNFIGLEIVD